MMNKYYVSFTGLGSSRVCDSPHFSNLLVAIAFGKSNAVPTSAGSAFVAVYLSATNEMVAEYLLTSNGWRRTF